MKRKPTTARPITVKEKPPLKLRHEYKHQLSPSEMAVLSRRLKNLFPLDPNAGSHGFYRVSSLYFDTPADTALREKLSGVNTREKFRLRYYGSNPNFLKLEKKFKVNGLCGKHSAILTRPQAEAILQGDYSFLLQTDHPLLLEFYAKLQGQQLRPKTVVTYDRQAFLYAPGNVRLTLDQNLRTTHHPGAFLDPEAFHFDVSQGLGVLEVKYDEFLPDIVRMAVQTPHRQASSNSKYALCRLWE